MRVFNTTFLVLHCTLLLLILIGLFEFVYVELIIGEIGLGGLLRRLDLTLFWFIMAGFGLIYFSVVKLKKQPWQGLVRVNGYVLFFGLTFGAYVVIPFMIMWFE